MKRMVKVMACFLAAVTLSSTVVSAAALDNTSSSSSQQTVTVTPSTTPEAAPSVTPTSEPEVTPETAPDATPEATPEAAPETTQEVTPEATPEVTPAATEAPVAEPSATPSAAPQAKSRADAVRASKAIVQSVVDGKKYFSQDGKNLTGWYTPADNPSWKFYLNPADNGAAVTGVANVEGKNYIFTADGLQVTVSGTPVVDGKKYFVQGDGTLRTGWLDLGNWRMYFDGKTFQARVGLTEIDGKKFIFNNDGVLQGISGTPIVNGKKYFFNSDGSLRSGWVSMYGWNMYFDPTTYEAKTGLAIIDGKGFIFNNDGVQYKASGTPMINGAKYYIDEWGALKSGWLVLGSWKMYFDPSTYQARTGVSVVNGKTYYFTKDGVTYTQAGTPMINGEKYWITNDGSLGKGWLEIGNWSMYFYSDSFKGAKGISKIDGKTFMFDANGIQLKGVGTIMSGGKKYYLNKDYSMNFGWQDIGAWTMYFYPDKGYAATGVSTIGGNKLVFNSDGVQLKGKGTQVVNGKKYYFWSDGSNIINTGWQTIGNWTMYFFDNQGYAATGFQDISGNRYYFNNDGVMMKGLNVIGGQQYYFNEDGTMAKNTWVDVNGGKLYFGANGAATNGDLSGVYPGPYKLMVDRVNCVITVYAKDGSGNFTIPVKAMTCSVGRPDSPTVTGTFNLGPKFPLKELMGPSWGQYATRFYPSYYFHSVATTNPNDPVHSVPTAEFNKLGQPASAGCVRLCVRDAKWIYDNCGSGSIAVVGDNFAMPLGKPDMPKITGTTDPTDPRA